MPGISLGRNKPFTIIGFLSNEPGPNSVVMFSPKSWQSESVSNDGDFSERKVTYLEILTDLLRFG